MLTLNGAPSQIDRRMAALSAGYVAPDERSFAQLLQFAVEYGRLIIFYDLENRPDGDWQLFFAADPSFALASVAEFDLAAAEFAFNALLGRIRESQLFARKFELLCEGFDAMLALARRVQGWMEWPVAGAKGPAQWLQQQLAAAVTQSLGPALQNLAAMAAGAGETKALGRVIPLNVAGFSPIWGVGGHVCPDPAPFHGARPAARIDHALAPLANDFEAFADALGNLRAGASAALAAALGTQDNAPQAAMFIAFARLFAQAQAAMNDFSGRLADFYYGEVLRERVRAAAADRLFLNFTIDPAAKQALVSVPAGSVFPAGMDAEGLAVAYRNDLGLGVSAASLEQVLGLAVTQAPLLQVPSSPPAMPGSAAVGQVLATTVKLPAKPAPVSWSLFGRDVAGDAGIERTVPATLGFAVAAAVLGLSGGSRSVQLTLAFDAASLAQAGPDLRQVAAAAGLSEDAALAALLSGAFGLFVSAAGGWLAVVKYAVTPVEGSGGTAFAMRFALPASAVAVTGTASPLPAGAKPPPGQPPGPAAPDPAAPVLAAYLLQERVALGASGAQVAVYPLAILQRLGLARLDIEVQVTGLTGLGLSNPTGPVDPAKPFLPFGAPAVPGAALLVRQPELFGKQVETLCVTVNWFNLPQTSQGFYTYYQDYTLGPDGTAQPDLFDNRSFLVDFTIGQPGYWRLPEDGGSPPGENRYLFQTQPGNPVPAAQAALLGASVFADLAPEPSAAPAYYDPGQSALVLTLAAPAYGFGELLYARNVMAAVVADLPDPVRAREICLARCGPAQARFADTVQVLDAASTALIAAPDSEMPAASKAISETALSRLLASAKAAVTGALDAAGQADAAEVAMLRQELAKLADSAAGKATGGAWPVSWFQPVLGVPAAAAIKDWQAWVSGLKLGMGAAPALQEAEMLLGAAYGIAVATSPAKASPAKAPAQITRMQLSAALAAAKAQVTGPFQDCMAKCLAEQDKPISPARYPNPPWQPQAASFTLDYGAVGRLPAQAAVDQANAYYHLTPFGGFARVAWPVGGVVPLLPELPGAGACYLGLSGVAPPQPLTLLVQLAAGGEWSSHPPALHWQMLAGGSWIPLAAGAGLRTDGTGGLQNTGIIGFALPEVPDADAPDTQLPAGLLWLSVTVAQNTAVFPRATWISTNALEAGWAGPGGADRLGLVPLPAGTIKAADPPLPGIATITQPLASFGGRPRLTGEALHPWLGERLRHKNRAVQSWDYAYLVLAQFPFVWQCAVLPARGLEGGGRPGRVLVVVVPGPAAPDVIDPTVPAATTLGLSEIGAYLESVASAFLTIEVSNPVYVRITVTASMVFRAGGTPQKLNEDLIRYLSPWYYDARRAALGKDYVSEDSIAAFIRDRPYVQALLNARYSYAPSRAGLDWCYLTSARQHDISDADVGNPAMLVLAP